MSDALQRLADLIGDDYVITSRYYECEQTVTGKELAKAIDALIKQRVNEALRAAPNTLKDHASDSR